MTLFIELESEQKSYENFTNFYVEMRKIWQNKFNRIVVREKNNNTAFYLYLAESSSLINLTVLHS